MINCDYYYAIGKTHLFCQDYVIRSRRPNGFLLLSDGCSSSAHTDVGARILSITAKTIIESYLGQEREDAPPERSVLPEYRHLGQKVSEKARETVYSMGLDNSALDATLLLAFLHQGVVHVYLYGDGCILLKKQDGGTSYIEAAFSNNTPYYLSYWHDEYRRQAYIADTNGMDTLRITDSGENKTALVRYDKPLHFSFSLDRYAAVAIASDGVTEFLDTVRNVKIPLDQIAKNLLDFKSLHGEFAKRRLPKAIQRYANEGIYPLDDVSMGAFVLIDDHVSPDFV